MNYYDYDDFTRGYYQVIEQIAGDEWDNELTVEEKNEIFDNLFDSTEYHGGLPWSEIDAYARHEIAKYMEHMKGGL